MIHIICPNPAIDRTIMLDDFSSSVPNRPLSVKEFPGGKGFNVAYAIGFNSSLKYCVHTILGGTNGIHLINLAKKRNIPVIPLEIDDNTRICSIIIDKKNMRNYPIYENSFNLQPDILEKYTNNILEKISENDSIIFSGSLMKGMPDTYISNFIDLYKNKNVKVFVDTSGAALYNAYKAKPYAIKINDEEIYDIFPDLKIHDLNDYINLLKSDHVKDIPIFIITLGEKGIVAKFNNNFYYLYTSKVTPINPIASGDFFLGALVKYIALGLDELEVLKKSISYSTANVLNLYPELFIDDINTIYQNIVVKQF